MNQIARLAAVLLIAMPLSGLPMACSAPSAPADTPPLSGARIGGPFMLVDQDGKAFGERDLAGRYRIMYFGYTFCPDVCPVDVQNLAAGLRVFEQQDAMDGMNVVPVFVTVDPTRDTPAVLKQFVGNFHPRMIGLTGSAQAIAAMAGHYGIFYQKGEPTPNGGYMVNHSRVAYLMSPDGKPIMLLSHDGTPQKIAAELQRWVR